MDMRTHYDNLKVARNAPLNVIRAAYKTLSQQYHPDRNPGNSDATRIMTVINTAYEVLSDPEKRETHDKLLAKQDAIQEEARINAAMQRRKQEEITAPSHEETQEQPEEPELLTKNMEEIDQIWQAFTQNIVFYVAICILIVLIIIGIPSKF